jgi:hypothetical protein
VLSGPAHLRKAAISVKQRLEQFNEKYNNGSGEERQRRFVSGPVWRRAASSNSNILGGELKT